MRSLKKARKSYKSYRQDLYTVGQEFNSEAPVAVVKSISSVYLSKVGYSFREVKSTVQQEYLQLGSRKVSSPFHSALGPNNSTLVDGFSVVSAVEEAVTSDTDRAPAL